MTSLLTELSIKNFAIIDDISISFNDGLTIMTGETGAGKSIIIDAVQLLTGGRGSVDFVRHGEKKSRDYGTVFIDDSNKQVIQLAKEYDINLQDEMLVLERTITNQGKSVCRINGKIVTLTILREFGQLLVTIHSQHDTIQLADAKYHLTLLDKYSAEEINPVKDAYRELFEKIQSLRKEFKELTESEQKNFQRIDLLEFQLHEIEQAGLKENEDTELESERNHLHNFEKIYQAVNKTYYTLYGEGKVLEQLNNAKDSLAEAEDADQDIKKNAEELTNIFYQLEEISFQLRDYNDSLTYDEDRLNEIESRLFEINKLKKKYGESVQAIIDYKYQISSELDLLKHKDDHIEHLKADIDHYSKKAEEAALKLHQLRKNSADLLTKKISKELKDLYLPNAVFHIQLTKQKELNVDGIDHAEFLLSANSGEPLKPLSKIASGGELSRIMLAMHKVFVVHDEVVTVIFDEIDTGVSGRVAQAHAEKMYHIASIAQVMGITHLAQVAAMADAHIVIQKQTKQKRTSTSITELNKTERTRELAKMITGNELTNTAIEHANQLLVL